MTVDPQSKELESRARSFPIAHQAPWWDGFSCGCEGEPHSASDEEQAYQVEDRRRRGL